MPLSTIFQLYIVAVSLLVKETGVPRKTNTLLQVTDYHIMYRVHLAMSDSNSMLVVIGTDCIGI